MMVITPPKSAPIWVLDGQAVYCQDGLPYAFDEPKLCQYARVVSHSPPMYAISRSVATEVLGVLAQDKFVAYRSLVAVLDVSTAYLLSKAIQLLRWDNEQTWCGVCGSRHESLDFVKICPNCQHTSYPHIQPCVITAITHQCPISQKTQLLLAKHHRRATIYTLIAGFVEVGESLEMAVRREVLEEVGLTIGTPRYAGSQPWPYPTNLMVGFVAEYQSGEIVLQQDELLDARFFEMDNLPALPPIGTIARRIIDEVVKDKSYPPKTITPKP